MVDSCTNEMSKRLAIWDYFPIGLGRQEGALLANRAKGRTN